MTTQPMPRYIRYCVALRHAGDQAGPVHRLRGRLQRLPLVRVARSEVDWAARRAELLEDILERYRSRDGSEYDCIVPVSGGKDSTYQVLRLLELGA